MAEMRFKSDGNGSTMPASRLGSMGTPAPTGEPSLGELFRQLAEDSSTLIRKEITLAKAEVSQSVSHVVSNAVWVAVWGAVALVGSLVLVTFLVLLLGDLLDNYWLAALIVGSLFTLAGGLLAKSRVRQMSDVSLAPQNTLRTLQEDKVWMQAEARDLKRDLTSK